MGTSNGDAVATMSEADLKKLLALVQAIADALEGIEKQLKAIVDHVK